MRVWRLARAVHPALDGEGARRVGGRWNAPGVPVAYTSSHLSLAALEVLVHTDPALLPRDLTAFEIDVPDDLAVERVEAGTLPDEWVQAAESEACREAGAGWIDAGRSAVLVVPSAIVPVETNVLLNPRHAGAGRVRVTARRPFAFDPRLVGGAGT